MKNKRKPRALYWTGNYAYRDKGELFAYVRFIPSFREWRVMTRSFDTTEIPCASLAAARACIEAMYACEE